MKKIWEDYKVKNINNLIYNVKSRVNSLNKKIAISAAVKTNPEISKKKWSQDWGYWINQGLLDFIVTMNYYNLV